jgi:hypothetical protein
MYTPPGPPLSRRRAGTLGRTCSVCSHPESFEINEALVLHKQSNRRIAPQYGLDEKAIRRHREHIPELLLKAKEDLDSYEASSILQRIEDLEKETLDQLQALKDEDDPDRRTILLAIREQRANIELVAKIRQLIDQAPQVNVLVNHPEWVELRTTLLYALNAYPEARGSILRVLNGGANGGA